MSLYEHDGTYDRDTEPSVHKGYKGKINKSNFSNGVQSSFSPTSIKYVYIYFLIVCMFALMHLPYSS
jgi:hypothetical protein